MCIIFILSYSVKPFSIKIRKHKFKNLRILLTADAMTTS